MKNTVRLAALTVALESAGTMMAVVFAGGRGRTRHSIVIATEHSTYPGCKGWQTTRWRSTVTKAPKSLSGAKESSRWMRRVSG
ncbi:MAG: hypothetical protein ACR5LG_15775 [Sodalis sp. (in: enterobacteria)]|uniref:hypothetical protein n=1 Tax=Sodalis sp. (in: enterobacteria) TaxID=1898979 RepID=UPI003F4096E5